MQVATAASRGDVHRKNHRYRLGRSGEYTACHMLTQRGYRILDRNWHDGRRGEIDIVATAGTGIHFIEVRTRAGTRWGTALETVTPAKFMQVRILAGAWLSQHHPGVSGPFSVDVITVTLPNLTDQLRHVLTHTSGSINLTEFGAQVTWHKGVSL